MRLEAARSAGWTLIEATSAQTLLLITFLILARLLTPADYGLMALATTILSVPQFILSNGLIPVIINREKLSDDDLSTAFWSSLGIGIALMLLTIVCAGPIAWLLRNPALMPILRWSSISFVFMAAGNVPSALYQKRFQYRIFAIRSLISFLGGGIVGIVLALRGCGVWSLVFNLAVQNIIAGIVVWIGLGWRPRFRFRLQSFLEMRDHAYHTIAGNFLSSITMRIDMLVIGAVNPVLLGYYYFGQRLLLTISVGTYVPIGNVLVPVLSRVRTNKLELREAFMFMLWTAQVLWMPIVAGLGAIASVMVPSVFGVKWVPAISMLEVICVTAFTTGLYQYTYSALLAADRTSIYPKLTVIQFALTIALIAPAARFGLLAIAWAYVAVSVITAIIHLGVLRAVLGLSFLGVFVRLGSVVVATASMVLVVLWLSTELPMASASLLLPGQITLGALVYVVVLFLVGRSDSRRLKTTIVDAAFSR